MVHPVRSAYTQRRLLVVLVTGAAVTAAVALFAANHEADYSFSLFGSAGTHAISVKSKVASAIAGLALMQLFGALWIYGKLPGLRAAPRRVAYLHRAAGTVLFLATVPVAIHCVWAYGFQTSSTRVFVHSLAGCFFYGAFAAKVVVVRSRRLPGWVLPTAGGVLFTVIVVLWYSSALWFFNGYHVPLLG
ncbi:MAG: hypothetical protein QOJ62_398 [Actinomycetota bacterium]|jgi:hypothetical protein|nr:hypothetical protein [Actinomycetota bacterium]